MMADLGTQGHRSSRPCPRSSPACDDDVAKVVVRSFKKRGIDIRTGVKVTGHDARRRRRHDRAVRRGRVRRGRPRRRLGRPPPALRDARASTAPASRSTSAASSRSTSCCRTGEPTACTPSATSSPRPALAHVGFAEAHRRHQGHPRRGPVAGRLRQGAVVHLLPPRGRLRRPLRGRRPRRPASTSSCPSTATPATAGRMIVGETEGLVKVIAEKGADGTGGPHPRRAHGRARGSPSSSARATSRSTGRPPSTRSPTSSSPTRRCQRALRRDGAVAHRPLACTADRRRDVSDQYGRHHDAPAR